VSGFKIQNGPIDLKKALATENKTITSKSTLEAISVLQSKMLG
jgi:hypothetical protein